MCLQGSLLCPPPAPSWWQGVWAGGWGVARRQGRGRWLFGRRVPREGGAGPAGFVCRGTGHQIPPIWAIAGFMIRSISVSLLQGRNWRGGGGAGHASPLLNFILCLRTCLLMEAQLIFSQGLKLCIISAFLLQIYLRPPLKITQLRPLD